MKTPLPPIARIRALLFALVSLLVAGPPVRAQVALQLPISRATHSFSLWEPSPWISSGDEPIAGWPHLGMPAGYYWRHEVLNLGLIGGGFDSEGIWRPGSDPFLSAWVGDAFSQSSFIVVDDTTGEAVQPNRLALAKASWFPPTGEMGTMFFAIEEGRETHAIALEAYGDNYGAPGGGTSWSGWFPVSNGQTQGWIENGVTLSLGYFEAWSFLPPGGAAYWRLYDMTAEQSSLDGLTWTNGYFGDGPVASVRMRVAESGQVFTIYGNFGNGLSGTTQQAISQWDENEGANVISASIGILSEFHVRRDSDGRESFHYTVPWGGMVVDETANFTGSGPVTDWQSLTFYATNPTGMVVRRTADNAEVSVNVDWTSDYGLFVYDPTGTQSVWVSRYECSADVDVAGGWTVIDGNAVDRGQGPEFMDWPVFASVQTEVVIPVGRNGHVLKTSFGDSLSYLGSYGSFYYVGAGSGYSIYLDRYQVPIPEAYTNSPGPITIVDETAGDGSPTIYMQGYSQYLLPEWSATSPLILKISATRWNNNLQIICANGSIFPITRHQVQGDWSWAANGSFFNSYGYFDAEALCLEGMPWELYDTTRGVSLSAALGGWGVTDFSGLGDDTDSDGDTLPDWYERMIGTNPNNANTDGDSQGDDAYEIAHGTNPRAASVTAASNATLSVFTPLE